MQFQEKEKKFFLKKFCISELQQLKFLTQKETGNTNIYCIAISKFSFTEELS